MAGEQQRNAGRGNQQRNAGADIGTGHHPPLEIALVIVAHHHRPVRVAEYDLRAHVYELVHEEQAAFEHLLMYEHASVALRRDHQQDAQQVRRQTGPGRIRYLHNGAVQIGFDAIFALRGNIDIVPLLLQIDAQTTETVRDYAQVLI